MTISKHFMIEGNRRNGYLSMTVGIADIIIIDWEFSSRRKHGKK